MALYLQHHHILYIGGTKWGFARAEAFCEETARVVQGREPGLTSTGGKGIILYCRSGSCPQIQAFFNLKEFGHREVGS